MSRSTGACASGEAPPAHQQVRYDDYGEPHVDRWTWDDRKRRALECVAAGWPKTQIARDVGVHRDTVTAWCSYPEFQHRLDELNAQNGEASARRRSSGNSHVNNRVFRMLDKMLTRAEQRPQSVGRDIACGFWLDKYLRLRAEERQDARRTRQQLDDHRGSGR